MKLLDIIKNSRSYGHYFLHEGLIKSTSMPQTYRILKKHKFYVSVFKDDSPFAVSEYMSNLLVYVHDVGMYSKLKSLLNIAGWYFATAKDRNDNQLPISANKLNDLPSDIIEDGVLFTIEPKYDMEVDWENMKKSGTKMYHATPKVFWKKIQIMGLAPKSLEKKSFHPERVYLTRDPRVAVQIANELSKFSKYSEYVVLEVDLSKLSYNPKLYSDPNFSGLGVYMVSNIPSKAISLYKEISV